jgi:hypothetical protein
MRTLFGCEVLKPLPLMVMVTEFMPDVYEEGEMEVMTGAAATVRLTLLEYRLFWTFFTFSVWIPATLS